ncbi:MAG: hypothetical protein IZT56_05360 [Bacteroidetes bacterium]|nr:hypothetical protein [Bacteroidota bacterium]
MKIIELKFIESWGATREKGRLNFALRTGIVWSVITAIISKVFELSKHSFSEVYFSKSFLSFFAFFIIIGAMIFWKFIWEHNERKYHKLLKEKEDESNS